MAASRTGRFWTPTPTDRCGRAKIIDIAMDSTATTTRLIALESGVDVSRGPTIRLLRSKAFSPGEPLMVRHTLNAISIALVLSLGQPMSAKGQIVVPAKPGSGFMGFSWDPSPGQPIRVADGVAGLPPLERRPFPRITRVFPCSPADSAGIRRGDVMLQINGRDARQVPPPFNKSRPGVWQEIALQRGDDTITVRLREIKRPVEPVKC